MVSARERTINAAITNAKIFFILGTPPFSDKMRYHLHGFQE
jgi:hypothetical protein